MSQTPTQFRLSRGYLQGWQQVSKLALAGGSWSGRERNCVFLNTGETRFADVSSATGLDFPEDCRIATAIDWDFDGDLDLWLKNRNGPGVRFLRNDCPPSTSFVTLRLRGTRTNRDAIGARVELHLAGQSNPHIKTLHAGDGYLLQNTRWLHFGLPSDATIERVVVRWSGGDAETFANIQAGQRYLLSESTGKAEAWSPPATSPRFVSAVQQADAHTSASRTPLVRRRAPLVVEYTTLQGEPLEIGESFGGPVLINLWATSCAPCIAELREFDDRGQELTSAGVNVLALNLDRVDPESGTSRADVTRFLERLNFQQPSGFANAALSRNLQKAQRAEMNYFPSFATPTSLLLDSQHRLAVIYRGSVSVDQIIADAALLELSETELRAAALPFAGKWKAEPQP